MKSKDKEDIYPLTIIYDRYNGAYSDALFTAWNTSAESIPYEINSEDGACIFFWRNFKQGEVFNDVEKLYCGKGDTPNEAWEDLFKQMTNH